MEHFLRSIRTLSYWRYALFSVGGVTRAFAILGILWMLIELLDFFGMYTRDQYSRYAIILVLVAALFITIISRRPVSRITYAIPKKDYSYEILIGDLMASPAANIVISTNSTFDTNISSGLISPDSVQGIFTNKFFNGNTEELDKQINASLKGTKSTDYPEGKGNKKRYPIGTVARVDAHGKAFYLLAMSELNEAGNAKTDVRMLDAALDRLWCYIGEKGELGDTATAIIGTGRGRIKLSRKKVIERIAQSFADASQDKVFSNKLTIIVHPSDADKVNLFEVRDYLAQSLHV